MKDERPMSVELRLALQEERAVDLAERVRRLLGPFSGTEAALDSGCGTGALAFALAPHVAEVVGVDVREDYLEAGREHAPPNVRFVEGDAMALPFGYGEFDIAGCYRVLHHVRRPELAVSELARVTRPRRAGAGRRSARLGRPAAQPRDGSLRAAPRPDASAPPARCRHPRLPRRERSRAALVRGRCPSASISSGGSISAGSRRRSACGSAARRRRRRTRSRSAGTSLASPGP